MKNLFLVLAFIATASVAQAAHVIECTDDSGETIKATVSTQAPYTLADVTVIGAHYQNFAGNSSGTITDIGAEPKGDYTQYNFTDSYNYYKYSVNIPTQELFDNYDQAIVESISWTLVSQPDGWQQLPTNCVSYDE